MGPRGIRPMILSGTAAVVDAGMANFQFTEILPGHVDVPYRKLSGDEAMASQRGELADGCAVACHDERLSLVETAHDFAALITELALSDCLVHPEHCSTACYDHGMSDGAGPRQRQRPGRTRVWSCQLIAHRLPRGQTGLVRHARRAWRRNRKVWTARIGCWLSDRRSTGGASFARP